MSTETPSSGGKPPTDRPKKEEKDGGNTSNNNSNTILLKPKTAKERQLSWSDQFGRDLATQNQANNIPTATATPTNISSKPPPHNLTPPNKPSLATAYVSTKNRPALSNTDVEKWMAMVADSSHSVTYSPLTAGSVEDGYADSDAPQMPQLLPPREQPTLVTLQDVTGPSTLESEAENAILVAVERRLAKQQLQRARSRSDAYSRSGSTILQNVPETDVFRSHDENDDVEITMENHIPDHISTAEQQSVGSKATTSTTNLTSKPQTKANKHHRHTKTIDDTLFDLTQAMNAMHKEGHDENYLSGDSDSDNGNPPVVANTVFDQTATLVYRGKTDAELQAAKESAQKNWAALKQTVQTATSTNTSSNYAADHESHPDTSSTHNNNADNDNNNNMNTHVADMEEGQAKIEEAKPVDPKAATISRRWSQRQSQWVKKRKRRHTLNVKVSQGLISDARTFTQQRRAAFRAYLWTLGLLIAPAMAISVILFYFADNPPTGRINRDSKLIFDFETNTTILLNEDGEEFAANRASASWWILFLCVRQVITLSLAKMLQVIVIDFFCVSNRAFVNWFGQMFTLFVIQSRGWPFLMFTWGLLSFGLLQGKTDFAQHWGNWQNYLTIFTQANPSGGIPAEPLYRRVLIMAVIVGFVVSIKRVWIGVLLGKKIYRNYSEDLAKLMKKLLLLGKVAFVARDLARHYAHHSTDVRNLTIKKYGFSEEQYFGLLRSSSDDDLLKQNVDESVEDDLNELPGRIIESNDPAQLTQAERNRIDEYLGAWEEPEKEMGIAEDVSIDAILQFRQSLSFLDNRYLFSIAWGDTSTRESTIMASQNVYHKLNIQSPDSSILRFDVMTLAAVDEDGEINTKELKELIRLVRPDREGNLTLLEFVKSVDVVYKEARLLRAAIQNSEKVDRAFENVLNIAFYFILGFVVLSQLGINPTALFVAMSTNIVAFAFIIGPAMSKMFEGWLFILLQRPYDIGDRIHISNVQQDTNADGNPSWIVKDVTLFHTTILSGGTNEKATLSNSSMAASRIINFARSPNAQVYVYFKFSVEVKYEKIEIFHQALKSFVRARPREWANFGAFRSTKIMADLGYIEYITFLVHREAWQNVLAVLTSKADVASFGNELSKKLDMRYKSPPLPVTLSMFAANTNNNNSTGSLEENSTSGGPGHPVNGNSFDINSIMALFEKKEA